MCPIIFVALNYYNYFTEIEDTFIRRRGKHLLLSPIDWAMIEGWRDRGVPLHIVLRSIESVFDGFEKNPRPRSIKGLLYCKEEVEAQFEEWTASQAGKGNGTNEGSIEFSPERITEHVDSVIAELRKSTNPALSEDIDRAVSRLHQLSAEHSNDIAEADQALSDIETFLEQMLLTKLEKPRLVEAEQEVVSLLRPYKAEMEKDVFEQTKRVLLLKRLREEEGIPRLSLFYL
jgi:hypothetical protein